MLERLFKTNSDINSMIIRLALGLVILPHGMQKVFGAFGGYGFEGTMQFFTHTMGIPYVFALLAIIAEFGGGIGLILGFATRLSAFGAGFSVLIGALMVHVQNGFFMNWFGTQKGEGYEYHILFVAMALSLIFTGGGKFSLDRLISKKLSK